MRELEEVAERKLKSDWRIASFLAAAALNANPFRSKPVQPSELFPFVERKRTTLEKFARFMKGEITQDEL